MPQDSRGQPPLIERESFAVEQCGDMTIIRLVDPWHFETVEYAQIQQELMDFVERRQPRHLLVDLANIEYCATALINALLMAQGRVHAGSGEMKLFGLHGGMLEAMQHAKLIDTMFSVYSDEAAARNACL